ncbi:MAG: hypothetical protein ABWY04_07495 [Arthrobacter sp.]
MSWIRTFIRRHLIADDTAPQYSRLDQLDGRTAMPESTPTAAEARHTVEPATTPTDTQEAALAAIQKRLTADAPAYGDGTVDQSIRDRRYLFALVREQAAKLEKVRVIERRLEGSMQGENREIAQDLRAALTATTGVA